MSLNHRAQGHSDGSPADDSNNLDYVDGSGGGGDDDEFEKRGGGEGGGDADAGSCCGGGGNGGVLWLACCLIDEIGNCHGFPLYVSTGQCCEESAFRVFGGLWMACLKGVHKTWTWTIS